MTDVLCVGGPLHGLRRPAYASVWLHRTCGGPDGQGVERHAYDMRIAFRDGRRIRWWQWRMKPRWTAAGIKGPAQ